MSHPQWRVTEFCGGRGGAARTVALLHGWPDLAAPLYRSLAPALETAGYRVVFLDVPGYYNPHELPFFGYGFYAVSGALRTTLKGLVDSQGRAPLVVAHDWGVALLNDARCADPQIASKFVLLDIGFHVNATLGYCMFSIAYQWTLAFLYLLPRAVSTPLTKVVAAVLGVRDRSVMHSGMNYMYLRFWTMLLTGNRPRWALSFVPPTVPTLFLYGAKKPIYFHSPTFVAFLKSNSGSNADAYPGGHWFFNSPKFSGDVNAKIIEFLAQP